VSFGNTQGFSVFVANIIFINKEYKNVTHKTVKHFMIKNDSLKRKINEFVTYFKKKKKVIRNMDGHIHEINKG